MSLGYQVSTNLCCAHCARLSHKWYLSTLNFGSCCCFCIVLKIGIYTTHEFVHIKQLNQGFVECFGTLFRQLPLKVYLFQMGPWFVHLITCIMSHGAVICLFDFFAICIMFIHAWFGRMEIIGSLVNTWAVPPFTVHTPPLTFDYWANSCASNYVLEITIM